MPNNDFWSKFASGPNKNNKDQPIFKGRLHSSDEEKVPHRCNCIDRLDEITLAKLCLGEIFRCRKCFGPVFADFFVISNTPFHFIIRFGNFGNKFALMSPETRNKLIEKNKEKLDGWKPSAKSLHRARFID